MRTWIGRPSRVCLLAFHLIWITPAAASADPPDFESDIGPVLVRRCVECHRGDDPQGGLNLTSRKGLRTGGESGAVITLQDVDKSYLLQRIQDGEMPPAKQGHSQRLPAKEIQLLQDWIAAGASWPDKRVLDFFERTNEDRAGRDWWSLQPVRKPALPKVAAGQQPQNPIDAFILARLQQQQLSPAPPASKRTLVRRLYYDLIGLPPTQQQIESFVNDESPDAWERLIDQLLERPQYGERWGRYWLDLVRYADTSGYERDQEKPFAWKYRDWVVNALNEDMPFDEFIIHQLAGDEIDDRNRASVIATGFLRLGTWNDEPNQPRDYQFDRLEDMVHTTSSAFLGLTVKCARCHAHKFDPIQQEDYYRMAAAFWAGPIGARDRKFLGGPTPEEIGFKDVLAWTDLNARPQPLHVLKNGNPLQPMSEVTPASLSTISALEREFIAPDDDAKTSRRRLQLAQWIADAQNPLTPRVLVNRLWQHHLGQAIVRTPNNFGFRSDPPTHPLLLDWLAAEFVSGDFRIKRMHKLILMSQTWQQSSVHPEHPKYALRDAGNRLWWRAQRRRLDAEAMRDSLLAVSNELDLTVGGESFRPTISPAALEGLSRKDAAWQASPPEKQHRRSLYIFLKRGLLPPMMTTFDLSDPTQPCGQRDVTIVPTQALALLNHQFIHDRSRHLAATIMQREPDRPARLRLAWSRVLQRLPTEHELQRSLQHVRTQHATFTAARSQPGSPALPAPPEQLALASLCQVLMNSNEFLYVD